MRRLWLQIHLWLGLSLGLVGIFVGITGSLLVYDHEIDAWLNPQRYAVSGPRASLAFADYARAASQALKGTGRIAGIHMPEQDGMPVVALARAPGMFYRIYLDPPTGRVLEAVEGGGILGWVHRFHENLTLRAYWGREIVGLVGIAMLISSLSGLYLWWPRAGLRRALGPRAGLALSRNLHYLAGFYGCILLSLLSFTGIWLAYPQLMGSPRNVQAEAETRNAYRVSLRDPSGAVTMWIDPMSGKVLRRIDAASQRAGDRFQMLQGRLHTGEALGGVLKPLYFAAGLLPALLAITGLTLWIRRRLLRSRVGARLAGGLAPNGDAG